MFRGKYVRLAGPHQALIKSSGKSVVQVTIANRLTALPLLERIDQLSLHLRTIIVNTPRGTTLNGVTINVKSCCQVKIQGWSLAPRGKLHQDDSAIRLAAQHFLGKSESDIDHCIAKTIAGHQRAIIGVMTVEQLYRDRETFSKRVLDLCYDDMRNMGLSVVSYTVAEITDRHGYIEALGVPQTELVKRQAAEGKAFHQGKARARKAQEEVTAQLEVNKQEIRKFESDKIREIAKLEADGDINGSLAAQDKAPIITDAEQESILLVTRQKAKAAEAEAELEAMRQRVKKMRLAQVRMVHVEADAMLYKATIDADRIRKAAEAEAEKTRVIGKAKADAEAVLIREMGAAKAEAEALYTRQRGRAEADVIRAKGMADAHVRLAEAEAIEAKGMAEVDVLRERLEMWKQSGNQGIIAEKIIEQLPNIASAIAEPLAQTEKMVFVGSDESSGEAANLIHKTNKIGGY